MIALIIMQGLLPLSHLTYIISCNPTTTLCARYLNPYFGNPIFYLSKAIRLMSDLVQLTQMNALNS